MNPEPTLRDAAIHLAVNAMMAGCYTIILLTPPVLWVMTP